MPSALVGACVEPACDSIPQPLEFLVAGEVDRDPPAALGRLLDLDLRAQRPAAAALPCRARAGPAAAATAGCCPRRRRSTAARRCGECGRSRPARSPAPTSSPCESAARTRSARRSSPSGNSARAWPARDLAARRPSAFTSSGRSSSRTRLAIVDRSTFTRAASSSCVHWYSSMYRWNDAAFSIGLRSLRCTFSTIASSAICRSVTSRICTGTRSQPAICAARSRRSPAMSWYRPSMRRTTIGCRKPCVRMLSHRSAISASSNAVRGWYGLRSIAASGQPLLAVVGARHVAVVGRRRSALRTPAMGSVAASPYASPYADAGSRRANSPRRQTYDPTALPTRDPIDVP